ncbi:BGTF surface domain-containing protein [Halosimplex sp. TS25]|uniref:DUF7282 domain-containing protein n=1 Tax=Halosimplex rarum TaxID=3396619 RepID=UPI0039E94CCF
MPSTQTTGFSIAAITVAVVILAAAVPPGVAAAPEPDPPTEATADRTAVESDGLNLTFRTGARVEFGDLDSTGAVRRQVAAGRLPEEAIFPVGDPFVVEITHAGLAEELGDGNATTAFLDTFGTPAANLTFEGKTGPMRASKWIDPFPNGTRAFVDAANDTTYVVVDTDRVAVVYSDAPGPGVNRNVSQPIVDLPPSLVQSDHFRAKLTLAGGSNLTAGDERLVATRDFVVRIRTAEIRYDDELRERVYLDSAPNQTIRGVTNVRPGLNITVRLRSDFTASDSDDWVARQTTATVAEDGTFSAVFDLSDVSDGTVVDATVRFDERNILDREGYDSPESVTVVVTAPTGSVELRGTERNASGSYDAVTVDATLSRGGFVVLHRGTATGPIAGVSGHLSPGNHERIPVYVGYATESTDALVAVVHRDENQNGWFDNASVDRPYATSGDAVADTGFAPASPEPTIKTATPGTATDTPASTATATPATNGTGTPTQARVDTDTGAPMSPTADVSAGASGSTTVSQSASPASATETETKGTTTTGAGPGFGVVAALFAAIIVICRLRQR